MYFLFSRKHNRRLHIQFCGKIHKKNSLQLFTSWKFYAFELIGSNNLKEKCPFSFLHTSIDFLPVFGVFGHNIMMVFPTFFPISPNNTIFYLFFVWCEQKIDRGFQKFVVFRRIGDVVGGKFSGKLINMKIEYWRQRPWGISTKNWIFNNVYFLWRHFHGLKNTVSGNWTLSEIRDSLNEEVLQCTLAYQIITISSNGCSLSNVSIFFKALKKAVWKWGSKSSIYLPLSKAYVEFTMQFIF